MKQAGLGVEISKAVLFGVIERMSALSMLETISHLWAKEFQKRWIHCSCEREGALVQMWNLKEKPLS